MIFCNENAALPAQVLVAISFSLQVSAARLFLLLEFLISMASSLWRGLSRIAQATARVPTHNGKYQTRKYWHDLPG